MSRRLPAMFLRCSIPSCGAVLSGAAAPCGSILATCSRVQPARSELTSEHVVQCQPPDVLGRLTSCKLQHSSTDMSYHTRQTVMNTSVRQNSSVVVHDGPSSPCSSCFVVLKARHTKDVASRVECPWVIHK
jgi:hypothetical protein